MDRAEEKEREKLTEEERRSGGLRQRERKREIDAVCAVIKDGVMSCRYNTHTP